MIQPTTHFRTCPLCEATCGLEIQLEGGRVTRTRGDEKDVLSAGFVCPKGTTLGALHEDPDRLREPLGRDAQGRHRPISWEEAFGRVEEGLRRVREAHSPGAVAVYLGNPNVHNLAGAFYVRPLIQALRTRSVFSASTVDQMPRHVSSGLVFGSPDTIPVPDLDRTSFLLMLGANPYESNGSLCTAPDFPGRLRRIQQRGGKVVVVDPSRTRTAQAADLHLPIAPGTDALLLLALVHVIEREGLARAGEAAPHLNGWEEALAAARSFPPQRVALRTGIDAATIERVARELAAAPSAAVYTRMGAHTTGFGTLASWAGDLLTTVTGNLDRPGGLMFPLAPHARPRRPGPGRGFRTGRWTSRVRGLPEVRGELPVAALAEEIETPGEGQIRALVTVAGNPVLSVPNAGGRLDRALASLEFMVSVDPYLNETTRHADVVLPPPSALERSHFDVAFTGLSVRNVANYSPAILPTPAWSEAHVLARLALAAAGRAEADAGELHGLLLRGLVEREVGSEHSAIAGRDPEEILAALGERPPEEQLLDVLLRTGPYGDGFGAKPEGLSLARLERHPHGVDLGALEPGLPELLSTPSGRVELFPEPIARDLGRLEGELAQEVPREPFQLIGRRSVRSCNSWMHNVEVLVRGRDRCTLQLHPEDAAALGVEVGARVRIRSRVGSLEAPVELAPGLRRGVVSLPHGYGHDLAGIRTEVASRRPGVNTNLLTDDAPLDPLSGNAVLNGIPVTLEAVPAAS